MIWHRQILKQDLEHHLHMGYTSQTSGDKITMEI